MLREGIYEEVINQKLAHSLSELEKEKFAIGKEPIDQEEASKKLAAYISYITRKALTDVRDTTKKKTDGSLIEQIRLCNEIIHYLSRELGQEELNELQIEEEAEVLTSLYSKMNSIKGIKDDKPIRPVTPISESSLFTGAQNEPNMMNELKKEIITADEVHMLVSFIKWSGLRVIIEELKEFTDRGGVLKVITTSYMEATDYKAINELSQLANTEVKVSYDTNRTRLHAKAYIFKRDTNFSTAYIGSSNLSNPALTSGLEWNVKVTEKDSFDVMQKVYATFESYWNDQEFVTFHFNRQEDHDHLKTMLKKSKEENIRRTALFDIKPYHYQKEVLEKLSTERDIHGKFKNLIVAATGVGKTVISAFDYRRFLKENGRPARLLFVAHREEILKQSLETFRTILKDFNFADLLVGREKPESLDHLFISVQSLNSTKLTEKTDKDFYDFIIVDEFHHAAAKSYQELLDYYKPKILLGLTATPERMDGKSVLTYFDDRIAAEIRLTEAIDRKLLSPFQYFGVSDTVDLSNVTWRKKGYDLRELENVYTSDKIRVRQIVNSLYKYVTDIDEVKGLGFCVGVEHAKYMAKSFNDFGIPSISLHGSSERNVRETAKQKLLAGEIRFIFVADLYNEGVDLPDVNTVMFLRPTESLTVFLQQLGRGLRLADGKECLTVLDFIGQAHKNYDFFEKKYKALIGKAKHSVKHYVENGFANLPKGSFIQLEKQAKKYILRNIQSATYTKASLIEKLKNFRFDSDRELTLANFLDHYQMSLYDLYGRSGNRSFARLLVEADLKEDFYFEQEEEIVKRLPYLIHLNSRKLLAFLLKYIDHRKVENEEEALMRNVFYYTYYRATPEKLGFSTIEEGLDVILSSIELKEEIRSILKYNYSKIETREWDTDLNFVTPLMVHSLYTSDQIMAALGHYNEEKRPDFREGVKYIKEKNVDALFVTLNKSEKDFSPSTLYEDYAINEKLFHWQSQNKTSSKTDVGQRYIHHRKKGTQIALFVREYKNQNGYPSPYVFLGTVDYVKHSGEKPMSITWRLRQEMPSYLVTQANKHIL
ncbi:DUF3427 domain-containing protein [Allobacillus sp. GCM10007491]|uniref:DUF3427 domain-containing protein n=1 Tax=Allobacillus saliphilus TaxID=2912308 RepID=A0A941HSE6_9BACI|nr:DUF3427 domain-containing protein [Allobacillus saliphilus]MBR7553631.1 DUF3427 domain-containing protein [Allobacillus saliphilus]